MTSLSIALKRKSIEKAQPTLPREKKTIDISSQHRTFYKELRSPEQQLKQYQKKPLYTIGNASTEKSEEISALQKLSMLKHSRFNDDHHNTESIDQLLRSKMGSNLPTFRTKMSKDSLLNSQDKSSLKRQSSNVEGGLGKDSLASGDQEQNQNNDYEGLSKQGQNYDDYILGEKIDEEDDNSSKQFQNKRYAIDHGSKALNHYVPKTEEELRLDQVYWRNEKRKLLEIQESQEMISILQEYKKNKEKLFVQSNKKHETRQMMAAATVKQEQKLEKSCSLPALKPKKEIMVPEVNEEEVKTASHKKNLIAKRFENEKAETNKYVEKRLKQSLSYGKLGFGRKRVRTICEQDLYEEEMNSFEEIKSKLKKKGIVIDSNKLSKVLVNMKNVDFYQKVEGFPQPRLLSNPLYKKFPL